MTNSLQLNQRATAIADQMAADALRLGIAVHTLDNGARILDCGINVTGGLEAGRLFAEVCMGGLGTISFNSISLDGWWLPGLVVHTAHPVEACLASQYAGWMLKHADYFAMGSGPARSVIRAETKLYDELNYTEPSDVAVLTLETRTLPTEDVASYVAERAHVRPEALTLLVAPTASTAGSVQIAARVVETALHKLHTLGFDIHKVMSGFGTCPLPPIAKSDARAIGRTNDAVLYAGQVHLTVRAEDAELKALVSQIPASTSKDYGKPFYDTLKAAEFDFYKIDPLLFSPAEIFLNNVTSGNTFQAGQINVDVLRQSFMP